MQLTKQPMISLQRQALTNFASSVWVSANKQSLRSALEAMPLNDCANAAIAELKRSNIPTLFKEMTMMILTDVGHEIIKWLYEIKDRVNDTTLEHQLDNLSWTVEGPLNRPKMARLLLENQSDLDLLFSFEMACEYCLEDKVRELWPWTREKWLLNAIYVFNHENLMVRYWILKLESDLLDIAVTFRKYPSLFYRNERSFDAKYFRDVILGRYNIVAVKFLFNSLSDADKIEALNIFKSFHVKDYLLCDESVFAYLLSHLNFMEMREMMARCLILMLKTTFNYFAWPNSEFVKAFDQHVSEMEDTVNASNGNDLLELADGSLGFFRRYNSKILFRYYWTRFTKKALKKYIIIYPSLLPRIFAQLCGVEDDVSIKMVIDSLGAHGYPKNTFRRCEIIQTLARYDSSLLKYYLARTLHEKSLAENLIQVSKWHHYLVHFKDIIAEILIEIFPHWNLNRLD